jgi:hypothetical protein
MDPAHVDSNNPLDLRALRLRLRWKRPPRHRPDETFILGPIPFTWVSTAAQLPGAGFAVAMVYRFYCRRYQPTNRDGLGRIIGVLRISADSVQRALHAAELVGLLTVDREPGCKVAVSILDLPEPTPGKARKPLYGPIPWRLWLPASWLPGKSLQTAAVCWLLAGWARSAEFELAMGAWADFGLTRFSCARGLDALERAGLVSVTRRPGWSPVITLRDGVPTSRIVESKNGD